MRIRVGLGGAAKGADVLIHGTARSFQRALSPIRSCSATSQRTSIAVALCLCDRVRVDQELRKIERQFATAPDEARALALEAARRPGGDTLRHRAIGWLVDMARVGREVKRLKDEVRTLDGSIRSPG